LVDVSADSVHQRIPARDTLARDAALLTDTVREAGGLALSLFRTELKNWTKGASSPVSEADIRVNDLLESRLRSAMRLWWLSEESVDDEARLEKRLVWIVDPIDGTRGYLAAAKTGASAWRWSRTDRPCWAVFAPASDEFFLRHARAGRPAQRVLFSQHPAPNWIFPRRRSEAPGRTAQPAIRRNYSSS